MIEGELVLNCLLKEKEYGHNLVVTVGNTTNEEVVFTTPTRELVTVTVVDEEDNVRWYPQVGYKQEEQRWEVPPEFPLVKSFPIRTPLREKQEVVEMDNEYDTEDINTDDVVTDPREVEPEEHPDVFLSPAIDSSEFEELFVQIEVNIESITLTETFPMDELQQNPTETP